MVGIVCNTLIPTLNKTCAVSKAFISALVYVLQCDDDNYDYNARDEDGNEEDCNHVVMVVESAQESKCALPMQLTTPRVRKSGMQKPIKVQPVNKSIVLRLSCAIQARGPQV